MARFQVNNNGTPAGDLVRGAINIMEAVRTAESCLAKTIPNGRDYQTVEDPNAFKADRDDHVEMMRKLREVYQYAEKVGLRAQNQRESQR